MILIILIRSPTPALEVDLRGTSWQAVQLGDQRFERQPPTLAFHSTSASVVVDTGCRALTFEYGLDTDGDAISFRDVTRGEGACVGDLADQDGLVTTALANADGWAVETPTAIRIIGRDGSILRLTRYP
ncbi:MAG: META domain-containing protein [Chloroflexota bacterium]